MSHADYTNDPRVIQRAVALWKGGVYGWSPNYQQALALVAMRLDVYCGRYADDRAPAAEGES
jgi:hypothetical protein